jgi:hypothetical protein
MTSSRNTESIAMTRTAIGARRRRFVLELPREAPDGFGGVLRTYAAGPQLWGAMITLRRDGP